MKHYAVSLTRMQSATVPVFAHDEDEAMDIAYAIFYSRWPQIKELYRWKPLIMVQWLQDGSDIIAPDWHTLADSVEFDDVWED
jgi:hypothetical protein